MSSRFVSGGTIPGDGSASTEASAPASTAPPTRDTTVGSSDHGSTSNAASAAAPAPLSNGSASKNAAEWARVKAELDAERKERERQRAAAAGPGGDGEKSLFEVLQANKAAKQAAFEEANRLKNQFRALDDDEIDFLDEIQDAQRQEEARRRREMEEGLARFHEAQKRGGAAGTTAAGDADPAGTAAAGEAGANDDDEEDWTAHAAPRKRREREPKGLFKGIKRKSTSEGDASKTAETAVPAEGPAAKKQQLATAATTATTATTPAAATKPTAAAALKPTAVSAMKPSAGLVDYGSDDSDD